jgi:PncC family amidohydrolase
MLFADAVGSVYVLRQLADEILEYAQARQQTIVTAESCSAGVLALAFAKGKGASEAFLGGFVTYAKELKSRVLGVPAPLLAEKTAVCGEVAEAMALGALLKSGASIAVSITGVAGPNEDEDGNPVGLVYCAVARSDGGRRHVRLDCSGTNPEAIIDEACVNALRLVKNFCFS